MYGYDRTLFIGDFGGSLGFLLGISLLSLLELIEYFIVATYRFVKQRRSEKPETLASIEEEETLDSVDEVTLQETTKL